VSAKVLLLGAVTVSFGVLTVIAVADVGYWGIIEPAFKSWGAAQVFFDLVILAVLGVIWMVRDARARGANPWPFVLLTFAAGSFGPLLYLIVRELRMQDRGSARGDEPLPQM
jgi:Terpene cyclase DEP1